MQAGAAEQQALLTHNLWSERSTQVTVQQELLLPLLALALAEDPSKGAWNAEC